jgi:xanthine dehydrogenase accessory factor
MEHRTFLDALDAQKDAQDFLLATVLEGQQQGTALLLCDGQVAWTSAPETLLTQNLSALKKCTTSGVFALGDTRVFAERFGAGARLVICGGGHVAAAAVRLAKLLDLPVTGLEDRPEYADALREAGADRVLCAPFETSLAQIPGSTETYFCVLTRAHAYDITCLKQILQKPAAYVGMMGSRGRSALVRRQLLGKGLEEKRVEALHAPIGLSIGSQTAEEIALSILAQVVSIKNARSQTEGFSSAILDAMAQADHTGQRAVLAVITARHGSTPREAGAKMLVLADGTVIGSVGGGIMEHRTILAAQEMLAGNTPAQQLMHFSADGKDEDAAAAACGGSMEIWLAILQAGEELK